MDTTVRSGEVLAYAGPGEFRRGWGVLLACAIGNAAGISGLPFFSLSSFMGPLHDAFGWSRGEIGLAATFMTVGIFCMGAIVGRLCDRFGVRRVVIPSIVAYALVCLALTQIGGTPWTLYAGYVAFAVLGTATTSVGWSRPVTAWFDRRRGLALGLMTSGSGVASMLGPIYVTTLIARFGWQAGWLGLAAVAISALPLAILLLRDAPQTPRGAVVVEALGLRGSQAFRTRQFWFMALGILAFTCGTGGVIIHLTPLLVDKGLDRAGAAKVLALMGMGIVVGRLTGGWLLDRLHGPLVAICIFACAPLSYVLLSVLGAPAAPFAVLFMGLSIGAEVDVLAYFTGRFFGTRSYSEIFGWLFGCLALGTAAGPVVVGALYEQSKSYGPALAVSGGLCLLAIVLYGTLGRYPSFTRQGEAA